MKFYPRIMASMHALKTDNQIDDFLGSMLIELGLIDVSYSHNSGPPEFSDGEEMSPNVTRLAR